MIPLHESVEDFGMAISRTQTLMGLDLGTKTIGVALSDSFQTVATPIETIKRKNSASTPPACSKLSTPGAWAASSLACRATWTAAKARAPNRPAAFARNLTKLTAVPICYWDERLSTVAAERALLEADTSRKRRAEVIDHVAASYILQGALDRLRHLRSAP